MTNTNLIYIIACIWAFLICASLVVWILTLLKPEKDFHELVKRTQSWWIMLTVFTIALLSSRDISLIFLAFISFLALKEFFSIIPTRRADRQVLFWAYLAIPIQYYWIHSGWYGMFIIFIPVYMFLFIPFCLLLTQQTDGFLKSVGSIQWGLMITVFALSHMAYLLALPVTKNPTILPGELLLYLVFLTQINDVAQYIWGKLLGKHKIIPLISPKKTWEGLIGGVVTTTILAMLVAPFLTQLTMQRALLSGILISCAGFMGDVTISAVKRDLQIKDTSDMIPGHGGILDRVDSLTFAAPLFFHFIHYLYY